jgi:hypothetical protein
VEIRATVVNSRNWADVDPTDADPLGLGAPLVREELGRPIEDKEEA